MATSQALQDKFARNVVYAMQVSITERPAGDDAGAAKKSEPQARLGGIISAVEDAGGRVGRIVNVYDDEDERIESGPLTYELQVFAADDEQIQSVTDAVKALENVRVEHVLDLAMETHLGGACQMVATSPIESNTDLRIVYTPGVARVCKAIGKDPALAREYTNISNKVAVATNGTAILGLGDIGPLAGLPVMEGKAAIFWEFAGVSAEPLLIDTHDADEFIGICEKLAVGFGAIQIEDVAAPACFKITRELDRRLDIPVFHDDQHGTATIVLAGLYTALKMTGRKMSDLRCAISGAGAAGTAIADLLMHAGIDDVVLCDSKGILHPGRAEGMNDEKAALAGRTNRDGITGSLADAMKGRELFIGVSQPNIVSQEMVRSMAERPIVLALANPVSEITVAEAYEAGAAVAADGRMMNNALAYPGIFRGALDANAAAITQEMLMAAAAALSDITPEGELMPEMMDPATHMAVADAVMDKAEK